MLAPNPASILNQIPGGAGPPLRRGQPKTTMHWLLAARAGPLADTAAVRWATTLLRQPVDHGK